MIIRRSREGLAPVERSLVEQVGRGKKLDLAKGETVGKATMRSWGKSRTCRASVLRDILLGRLAADPDPHGLRLRGARIAGQLDLENLVTDVWLELEDCLLEEGVVARDARLPGLGLTGCQIEHPDETPLDGERLICGLLVLTGSTVIGHAEGGAVSLRGASVTGRFDCTGMHMSNDCGPALEGDGLTCGLLVLTGSTVIGHAEGGAVALLAASVTGRFDCTGMHMSNDCGPALNGNTLQVGQNMLLGGEFTGSGGDGAVSLLGARIGGMLDCSGAKLCNDCGPALLAQGLQVGLHMFVRYGFTATGGEKGVAVDLKAARIGGMFQFAPEKLEHKTDPHRLLDVDGLTYTGVPQFPQEQTAPQDWWQELLRDGTPRYAAQPYQQLAAGYRALGEERQARQTLMAQRDDQLARAGTSWPERWWGKITKVTLGYGYKPWRALWFLAGVVAVSCALAVVLGAHGALAQTSNTATPGQACTVIQQVSVGLDLNLPVGTTAARAACDLTTDPASATAAWLTAAGWVLRVLAWTFAALFIAGFTSAVRKT